MKTIRIEINSERYSIFQDGLVLRLHTRRTKTGKYCQNPLPTWSFDTTVEELEDILAMYTRDKIFENYQEDEEFVRGFTNSKIGVYTGKVKNLQSDLRRLMNDLEDNELILDLFMRTKEKGEH